MRKIKILFITKDFSNYVERNTYYFSIELSKLVDLILWHEPGDIHSILNQVPFTPDFILLNDLKESRCPEITGLSDINIPVGIIAHDIHCDIQKRKEFIERNNVQYIFATYRDAFKRTFPKYKERMYWLPHFINPEIFKDYGQAKEIDWLMMGKVAFYYPLRQKIYRTMKGLPGFVYHNHPGYRNVNEEETDFFVGERYAKEINRSKIFLTDCSYFNYPLIKYYEVLGCNTLLLAPSCSELKDLGFIPDVNYVEIDRYNFLKKAQYYLENEEERKKIAQEGFKMVHANHTVEIRATQLVKIIERIICNSREVCKVGNPRIKDLVSIVIPVYNRENYIIESLESLVNQTYGDIEIIVVDDGSTDNTSKVVNEYIKKRVEADSRLQDQIMLISLPRNGGYGGALTVGMFMAKGEFIAVQDSDDISHPERIKKEVQYLRDNPQMELVGTLYEDFNDGHFGTKKKPANWIRFGEDIKKVYEKGMHCICHGTILFRGDVFDRLGGYNRRRNNFADAEWITRCVLAGVKANNIPEVLYYYRRHDKQLSKQ